MKILLTFTFCLISAGIAADIITVTGSSRRSVQIRCPYEAGYEDYIKYLCRGDCGAMSSGNIPVKSGSPPEDRRFSLYDYTWSRVFTVKISGLRANDAGTYWCAVEKSGYDIYTEVLLQVRTARTTGKITVTGSAGRSVEIRCPYEAGCEENLKYLCRGDCANEDIIKSNGQRFSLYNNTRSRVFTVTISDLRAADGGTYWCVVQKALLDIYTEVLLQVRTARTTGKITVTGSAGRSVEIRCPYEAGCEGDLKYLCRGDCANEDIIKSNGQRFSLSDDTRSRVFTVTISGLRETDGRTYWCVVQKALLDINTEILLQVRTARTTGKITVTGSAGRSVEIRCPYEAGCEGDLKYLCRGDCANEDIIKSSGQKFSLSDDTRSRVFTVTISGLRETDGRTYWCVVQKALLDIYTEVLLQVRTVQATAPPPAPSTTTPSVHTSAPTTPTPTTTAPSRDDTVQTGAPLSSAPVHTVVVPVVVVLLLTGLVLFFVLYKLHKIRGQEEPPKISKEVDEVDGDDPPAEETYENLQRGTDDLVYENFWR